MPPEHIVVDDEDYASSEDSDFAPEDAPEHDAAAAESSDDDDADDGAAPASTPAASSKEKRKKRKQAGSGGGGEAAAAEDAGFENSGDEAIIERGKKRQKKKGGRGRKEQDDDDDEGGEGGLIKTRSMRAVEKAERKAQPVAGPVTVDVDALWAAMAAAPVVPAPPPSAADTSSASQPEHGAGGEPSAARQNGSKDTETIKIKRTYTFAGKVHTEEKLVPRDSAEARLYLASQHGADEQQQQPPPDQDNKRMPRKAFRSAFEPVLLTADDERADLDLGMAVRLRAREAAHTARKLNTVEKSRMDWAGFVDKEGLKDELVLAGRAKGNFAGQQDFLARTEARREDDARRLRLAGKAS